MRTPFGSVLIFACIYNFAVHAFSEETLPLTVVLEEKGSLTTDIRDRKVAIVIRNVSKAPLTFRGQMVYPISDVEIKDKDNALVSVLPSTPVEERPIATLSPGEDQRIDLPLGSFTINSLEKPPYKIVLRYYLEKVELSSDTAPKRMTIVSNTLIIKKAEAGNIEPRPQNK